MTTPKFQPGDKVMCGEYPMNREGVIAAFGPYRDGDHSYFVQTNLGEVCYQERNLTALVAVNP